MTRTPMILAAAAALAAAPAGAATLTYADFSDTSGLQLNGTAASVSDGRRDVLRLTPATTGQSGSAFSTTAITLGAGYSFSTAFTFNINRSGNSGADGLVFVIQTNANTAGGAGGGIGYDGIANSFGVEFDTFFNADQNDPNDNHVGVDVGGSVRSLVTANPGFTMEDGGDLTAFIDYDGGNGQLEVRLARNGVRPAAALLTTSLDLAGAIGSPEAFVGFTSGTGAAFANHDIVNWQFRDSFSPIEDPTASVPEPATWGTMILGFGLVGAAARRRRTRAAARVAAA